MATRTAKLYSGEDQSPIVDYTDAVIWEESEFGTRAWQGEGSASSIVIRDPLGETGNPASLPAGLSFKTLPAKSVFVVQVGSDYLFRGRVGTKNYSRDAQQIERYRQADTGLHDTNWDLDNIFVHDYDRPAETDRARVQGLIASHLSGSPRRTTSLNGSNFISSSNTVSLPAHTYTRTSPLLILREISLSANKQFFVTGDTIGGGSLFYDGNDSTAYACTLSISDRASEVDYSTVFPPIWNVGPASTEDGAELLSEVVLFYGTGPDQYVTASDPVVASQYGFASGTFTDDTTESRGAAQGRANAILAHRKFEDKTYNVTIGPLTDAQVVLVKHGQTINIKARATTDADDQFRLMRIVQCRYTTPVPGTWFAHLQLGRPWKMEPYGTGPVLGPRPPSGEGEQPIVTDTASFTDDDGTGDVAVTVGDATNRAMYVAVMTGDAPTVAWHPGYINAGTPGVGTALTQVGSVVAGSATIRLFRLVAPATSTEATSQVRITKGAGVRAIVGVWVLAGVDQTTPETDIATNSATSSISSVTVNGNSGDLIIDVAGWGETNASVTTPVESSDQTSDFALTIDRTFGLPDYAMGGSHGSDETPNWSLGAHSWGALAVAVATDTPGVTTEPIGDDGEGTVGDSDGTFVGPSHVHEHGKLSPAATHHHGTAQIEGYAAGAPTAAKYLVTEGHASLSAEVVVGTTPGGELGGSWSTPTVDASHGGGTHAATQAAAEATAASALSSHEADTSSVHGISDTTVLATDAEVTAAVAAHALTPHAASESKFTVDPGTPTYDDTDPSGVEVALVSKFGIDSGGQPYFNSAGVTSGEEAVLLRDPDSGEYLLRSYNF